MARSSGHHVMPPRQAPSTSQYTAPQDRHRYCQRRARASVARRPPVPLSLGHLLSGTGVVLKLPRNSTDRRPERRGVVLLGCTLALSVDDLDDDYHCAVLPPPVATCSTYTSTWACPDEGSDSQVSRGPRCHPITGASGHKGATLPIEGSASRAAIWRPLPQR